MIVEDLKFLQKWESAGNCSHQDNSDGDLVCLGAHLESLSLLHWGQELICQRFLVLKKWQCLQKL